MPALILLAEQQALERFNDEVNDLQSQIASAGGDDTEVENLRHAKKIADIKAETDLSIAQRQQLERLEEQLHEANLKRIKQEVDARANANTDTSTDTSAQGGGVQRGNGANSTPQQPLNTVQRGSPIPGLTIDFSGATIIGGTKDQIAEQLARLVAKPLQEIIRRSA